MRQAFADEILLLGETNPEVVILSGDIGNRMFDKFKDRWPDRFYNCGIGEANMIGVAAGLAKCGLRPLVYTITPFVTARCIEQIKVDLAYYNLPVTIVGVGGGLSYAELGVTHLALDDIAMLRLYPNMTVLCPCDRVEVQGALSAILKHNGPVYLRLGKKNEPIIHDPDNRPEFVIGRSIVLREGADVCLLSTGHIMPESRAAADLPAARGVSAQLVSFHTIKPLDTALLEDAFARFKLVVTIEEHFLACGVGAAVAEWLVDRRTPHAPLLRIGVEDKFFAEAGNQKHARARFGLTGEAIAEKTIATLRL